MLRAMSGSATTTLPETMRASVYHSPGKLSVEERPVPTLEPGDALVAIAGCGICGTDIHLFRDGMAPRGTIGGHEWAGTIVAVGDAVREWRVGDLVVGGPPSGCGTCEYCRAARPFLCVSRPGMDGGFGGAFAEFLRIRAKQLFAVPDGLPLRAAALTEPLAVALHAITRSGVRAGESALVTGAGPLGLLLIAALRAMGVDDVLVSEPSPTRRERARAAGATAVCEPEALVVPRMPFDVAEKAVYAAFECSGAPAAMEAALALLRRAGTLVLVGTGGRPPAFDPHRILLNELVVTGAFNYDADGFPRALELLASGRLPLEALLEPADAPLEDLAQAIARLGTAEIASKVVIDPRLRGP